MKKLKWLYPGMLVKRWISLTVFGILMISMGFVIVIYERNPQNKAMAGLVILVGIACVIYAVKRILKSFMSGVMPEGTDNELVERIYAKRILEKGPKIVVVGGGTGLSTLLSGLKKYTSNITAIVTVADDGGSSGRLRQEFGVLPPGDIRSCLVSLSDSEDLLSSLFQYRFQEGKELQGHNFGNLFIMALSQVTGDFTQAIKKSSKVLAIKGNVFPATLQKVRLAVQRLNGKVTKGESRIREEKDSPIDHMYLEPPGCRALPETLDAIRNADMVVLGPGSLYTSVMPNLLIDDIKKNIVRSRSIKVYVCNVMTEPGETDGYSVSDHVRAIIKHTHPNSVNKCIANISKIPGKLYKKYEEESKFPVRLDKDDERWLQQERIDLVKARIASMQEFVRHDPEKLSKTIMELLDEQH